MSDDEIEMMRTIGNLRALLTAAESALTAETATREALRTQESRVMAVLANAGAPVGDVVAGVEWIAGRLAASESRYLTDMSEARAQVERLGEELAEERANREEAERHAMDADPVCIICALKAYAHACRASHPALADDIDAIIAANRPQCGCREATCPHTPFLGPADGNEMAATLMRRAADGEGRP